MHGDAVNPYDWQSHNPRIEIPRADVAKVAANLGHGGSAVVLGGRGMGKSVFLRQLKTALEQLGDIRVALVPAPPPDLTVRSCLDRLARRLGAPEGAFDTQEILDAYFASSDVPERLVLLFDEFDRYAESGGQPSANPPGRGFFNDLDATRRDHPDLAVAIGTISVDVVRDVLEASLLDRALHIDLRPFESHDIDLLASPFAERVASLREEVVCALHLETGGVPVMVTFALQQLWDLSRPPLEHDVAGVFADSPEEQGKYMLDLLCSVA